jgi:hypothetical protein
LLASDSNLSQHGNNYLSGGNLDQLKLIGGWLPGGSYFSSPEGFSFKVPQNSHYILQIHYAPGSYLQADSSQLNIKYATQSNLRSMLMKPLLNNADTLDSTGSRGCRIFIPAKTIKIFKESIAISSDISLISITPHMHLIGKKMIVYAYNSSTNDTIKLINDNWDFHWQGIYTFPKAVHIPSGYVLQAIGTYDNTSDNTSNPNNPPRDIVSGSTTHTEMMQVFFAFVPYKSGDENIKLDSVSEVLTTILPDTKTEASFALFPNPVKAGSDIQLRINRNLLFNVSIFSIDGKLRNMYNGIDGITNTTLHIPLLSQGVYIVKIFNNSEVLTQKLLVE